jgi:hypothetical protein
MSSSMWDMARTKPNYLYTKLHWWQDRVQWPFVLPAPQFLSEDSVSFMSFSTFLVWSDEWPMWDMAGTSLTTLYTKPHWWQDWVQWPFFLPAPQFLGEDSVSFMSFSRFLVWSDERLHVGHGRNKPDYPLHQTPLMARPSTMTTLPSCTTISQWRQYLSHVPS